MTRQDPRLNRWLTSTVDTYLNHFGFVQKPVVYEVGSRDGIDGHELAQRISSNKWAKAETGYENLTGNVPTIVLFECNPPQIEVIKQNYPEATLITEAISDKKGTVDFLQIHGDKNFVGSSTMNTARNDNWIKETSTIKVKTRRLDDVIKELGHEKTEIDIMKIDIEGYSYNALKSLGKFLRNVRVFHIESEAENYARAENTSDIAYFMAQQGYKCTSIEGEWLPNIIDLVFVREDLNV